jgi:hypothetical protein
MTPRPITDRQRFDVLEYLVLTVASERSADTVSPPPARPTFLSRKKAGRMLEAVRECFDRVDAKQAETDRIVEAEIAEAWDEFDRPRGLGLR